MGYYLFRGFGVLDKKPNFKNLSYAFWANGPPKVLFTNRCRWQNFCPSLFPLVDRLHSFSQEARGKRLGWKFCHLRLVNSTLVAGPNSLWVIGSNGVSFTIYQTYNIIIVSIVNWLRYLDIRERSQRKLKGIWHFRCIVHSERVLDTI